MTTAVHTAAVGVCTFIPPPAPPVPPLQVEYLLERGAEVNTGVKSSSLHYAACFGRPSIVKVRGIHARTHTHTPMMFLSVL